MTKYLFILLFTFTSYVSYCQRGEKIESLKVGYLSNKLNLDARTAERFWPVYHQYENEMMSVVQEKRRNQNETRNADEILDQEQKALDIKRKYNSIFSKIISGEQVNQLYRAEKDFRQMIINRAQKREMRQQQSNDRPQPMMNNNDRRMNSRPAERMNNRAPERMQSKPQLNPSTESRKDRFSR